MVAFLVLIAALAALVMIISQEARETAAKVVLVVVQLALQVLGDKK